jgi:hypothetical protein
VTNEDAAYWVSQSPVSAIGDFTAVIDALPSDVDGLLAISRQLVFHYRAGGGYAENGIAAERIAEIDLRYADAMLARLDELGGPPVRTAADAPRRAAERLVGCCRDYALLFVAMARHKGIPARARVGFSAYFAPGWLMDHVIAEVWAPDADATHAGTGRWRMVEPEIGEGHVAGIDGSVLDVRDVPAHMFLNGGRAWRAARDGDLDPASFVVAPDLDIPDTRGWAYLRHNLVHDLAATAKREMLLWDDWGVLLDPIDPVTGMNEIDPPQLAALDALAALLDSAAPAPAEVRGWSERDGFAVTPTVTTYSPVVGGPAEVDVSRVLAGG